MNHSRRKFFQYAGAAAAGALILPNWACTSDASKTGEANNMETSDTTGTPSAGSIPQYGIQLWSVRDDMYKDPKGVLKQLAAAGYKHIESFEGDMGIYWGMTNTAFKSYMDELGMTLVSSHCDTKKDFEKKAAEAAAIGVNYLITPHIGAQKSIEAWKPIVESFNINGEICKRAGIRYAYHNHAYSFQPVDGQLPQDYMLANTDADIVDFEMDIYWVVTGGKDPVEYLRNYPNRFRLCHVKDRIKGVPTTEENASCDLGTGGIDYPSILNMANEYGMKYYIVEQERWDNSTPLKSAEADAAYMKKLVFS
ncbi:MAG: sugar phosphate isomerase/epimerase [Saprospiraceae bacterium]|nr:sugar phosphate isomerase/epimerase [Saprospiraceae bacterium]MCF8248944.1 sugar phosphate isomerase/epimerase [Saprospiraceae bacterium]MCF8279155.1 sugar phosphate isomerase/epimerase [Bacteroidales bacterium]MCF8310838.1 sugar phosphate isomerase/epimerase [Saprospiraceae bacterium]MCF8439574.1 sugar phosphate isomerase/epimerase [Saprospiraceae bacterium]